MKDVELKKAMIAIADRARIVANATVETLVDEGHSQIEAEQAACCVISVAVAMEEMIDAIFTSGD